MAIQVSKINVTPLVDVMLVLLIIFMVTAPLLQHGLGIQLPKAEGTPLTASPGQISLVIHGDRKIEVDGQAVPSGGLRDRLDEIARAKPGAPLYIQADAGLPYGFVAQVLAEVRKTDIQKIGLVTEPVDTGERL
jgi:biopolymer transport protein TolR